MRDGGHDNVCLQQRKVGLEQLDSPQCLSAREEARVIWPRAQSDCQRRESNSMNWGLCRLWSGEEARQRVNSCHEEEKAAMLISAAKLLRLP